MIFLQVLSNKMCDKQMPVILIYPSQPIGTCDYRSQPQNSVYNTVRKQF